MGLVMRDGLERLTHAKRYSRFFGSICVAIAWPGYLAGAGRIAGVDPREMAKSDCIVIWGTNAVATQVNVMTHAMRARKERGAKIVAIDIYDTETMRQADLALRLKPGTDGALACAVMHVLFRDGYADRAYLERYADAPDELEAHLKTRDPVWASAITGLSVESIEAFAALVGRTKRTFFRLGYGFSRQRNGAANMHAALCVPVVTGAWAHEGGGAFHSNSGVFKLDKTMIEGLDVRDLSVRRLDQSRIGAALTGEREALKGGGPVKAMLIQNTNPLAVAPDQEKVRRGFARDDLFVCVHEQFLTDTARYADIVLPATMFLEHDDLYTGGGHQYLQFGPKTIEPPEGCRSNHEVIVALADRLGARHPGFAMTPREIIDWTLRASGRGSLAELEEKKWLDCQPPFDEAHFLDGFAYPDGKFRFRADWASTPFSGDGLKGPWREMPTLPDHWPINEAADEAHPFKLATSPARNFLNSSFTETPTSLGARAAADRADEPGRRGRARLERRRNRAPGQRARRDAPARQAVRWRLARPHRQRGRVAAVGLPRRARDQRPDRRRQRRAVRRRRVSRRATSGRARDSARRALYLPDRPGYRTRRRKFRIIGCEASASANEEAVRQILRRAHGRRLSIFPSSPRSPRSPDTTI